VGEIVNVNESQFSSVKRPWYQLGVDTLLILVTLIGVLLGLIGARIQQARNQRTTALPFKRAGCFVRFHTQWNPFDSSAQLKQVEFRGDLSTVDLETLVRDLKRHHRLEELGYAEAYVTRAGLTHIWSVTELTYLSVCDTRIDGPDLSHVAQLTNLEWLTLRETRITDAKLAYLTTSGSLRKLDLYSNPITGAGLAYLKQFPNLQTLNLNHTKLAEGSLAHLGEMRMLKDLRLAHTMVGDEDMACLRGLTNLEVLNLNRTCVTDAGLEHLRCLPKLSTVHLSHTPTTKEGRRRLWEALPVEPPRRITSLNHLEPVCR